MDCSAFSESMENKGKGKIMHLIHQSFGGAALDHHIADIAPCSDVAGIES